MNQGIDPPSGKRETRRRRGFRVVAVLGGVVLALLALELVFRVAGLGGPTIGSRILIDGADATVRYQCFPSNPSGEFVLVPRAVPGRHRLFRWLVTPDEIPLDRLEETPWCVQYDVPVEGLRGAATPGGPAPGVQRIAIVGDSFVFGNGVPQDETLSAHLATLFERRQEVLNCGRSGANLSGYVEIAQIVRERFDPSRLVVVCIASDIGRNAELDARLASLYDLVIMRPEYAHGEDTRPWWARASALAASVSSAWRIRAVTAETLSAYSDAHDPELNPEGLAAARADFARLAEGGVDDVAIVIYPLMFRTGGEYPLQAAHDSLAALAREAGLPVLDLADVFAGVDPEDMRVHDADHHPNGRAHEMAARRIAEWLRTDVPGFLDSD